MATIIHPTAIVSTQAEIGPDCEIGPYCIVGDHVRLGAGSRLQSHVILDGNLWIGAGAQIYPFACIGKQTQDLKYQGGAGEIHIGVKATLREYVTVHMPTDPNGTTRLGDNCNLLAYCHIAHDCQVGSDVIMSNGTNLGGHVVVEDYAIIGGLCGVHQFVKIGRMAMVGACCKVAQDIVPYALADGNPAVPASINKIGMKRRGLNDEVIRQVMTAYRLIFRSGLRQEEALTQLRQDFANVAEVMHMEQFVAKSERGIARP